MPSDDRERTFENALASHLRAASSAGIPGDPCADSEMLAAYQEGSLPPDQIASLKTHVTTCSRCREILAFLEATDQIPIALASRPAAAAESSVQVLPARKPARWLWVAPAGALAAALLVWVVVQQTNSVRLAKQEPIIDSKQTQIAKVQPASPPPLPRPSLDATKKTEAPPPDAFSDRDAAPQSEISPVLRQRARSLAKEKDSLSAKNEGTPGFSAGGIVRGAGGASPRRATPPASEQSLQSQAPRGVTESVTVESANTQVAQSQANPAQTELEEKSANHKRAAVTFRATAPATAGAAVPSAPAPSPERSQVNTESDALADQVVQQRGSTDLTTLGGTAGLRLANSVGAITVSAPGGRASWRIGQAGVIEFSSDAQKTWIVQPTGIVTDLLAGSAPSPQICWVVGRTGTILRTTDGGKHWRKVNPPSQDDLRSIFAVDARQATVSISNASYQTTDGGTTWTKLPRE